MCDANMRDAYMNIDDILAQLYSLKDNSADFAKEDDADPIWQADIDALEAAISIIRTLQDNGISDAEGVKNLVLDYTRQREQYKNMVQKFIDPAAPIRKDGVWHCPECNSRTFFNHSHCRRCGKRMRWNT